VKARGYGFHHWASARARSKRISRATRKAASRSLPQPEQPRFETAEPKYAFLNRPLAVGTAEIGADGPVHVIEEIL
jgi:hypothetical protein